MVLQQCMWCKGVWPEMEGPTHRYMQSTPGCWAAFGRVLAREYEDQRYFEVHRLTVDAYAVQHPGIPGRQSIQSVAFHLVRLGLFQENGLTPDRANQVMLTVAKLKAQYRWLEPPASLGPLSVAAVEKAKGVEQHMALVRGWAAQMWEVWSPHHHTIRAWANAALQCGQPSG